MICVLGLNGYASARIVDRIIAYINDDIITQHELEGRIEERVLELQQVYRFSQQEAEQRGEQEREKLLDQMIREKLLYQEAQRRQIEVSETDVDQYINTFKQNAGIESDEQLREELKRRELTLESFREQARQNLMAQSLVWQEVVPKLSVTDAEIDRFFEENRSEFPAKLDDVTLRHIFIAYHPTEKDIEETRAEAIRILNLARQPDADFAELVRKYSRNPQTRERNGRLDLLPEQLEEFPEDFRNVVNALQPNEIGGPARTDNGFHIVRLEARGEDAIQLRHIFLPFTVGEEAKDAARERAEVVRSRLEAGDDFATVAQELSEDKETKDTGGELGTRNLAEFPPEIRQVLEALSAGESSTPISTDFGIHIFQLDSRQAATLSLEEREQVRALLRQRKFEAKWQDYTEKLKSRSFVKVKLP